jgi:transcriptional regulator with PAS, ATPase and Fis domain
MVYISVSLKLQKGVFREDLYYRINVVSVVLPPLRNRKEDIPLLAEHFIHRFNRLQLRNIQGMAAEALSLLMAHDWPGNIRELENAIERAFILCTAGYIGIGHLPEELTAHLSAKNRNCNIRSAHETLDAQAILAAIERNDFNREAAALDLGIHKTTLFRKIRKLGIPVPKRNSRTS